MSYWNFQQVSDKNIKQVPNVTYEEAMTSSLCIKCNNYVRLDEFENNWSRNEYLLTLKCKHCQPRW